MYSKTVLAELKINIFLGMNFQKGSHGLIYCRQLLSELPQLDLFPVLLLLPLFHLLNMQD